MEKLRLTFLWGFTFLLMVSFVSPIEIPYNGLTLEWDGEYSFKNNDFPSVNSEKKINDIFIYSNLQNGKITQRSVDEDKDEVIDIKSRNFVTGDYMGNKTSQWINTEVTIGTKILITGVEYTVKSMSDKIYLRDFGNIETIKLEHINIITEFPIEGTGRLENFIATNLIWYDLVTGLKLKAKTMTTYNHILISEYLGESSYSKEEIEEYELRENNVDNDKDGLTDLQELFEHQTSPLLKDSDTDGIEDSDEIENGLDPNNKNSDGDWWIDGKDSNPLSSIIPLIYYIIGLILIIGLVSGLFWFKFSKKK